MSDQTEEPNSDQPGAETIPPVDSTIPDSDTGVAVGYTGEPSTFEPEEDAAAGSENANPEDDSAGGGTGPRSTEATGLSGEDRAIFQSHWDDFAAHID